MAGGTKLSPRLTPPSPRSLVADLVEDETIIDARIVLTRLLRAIDAGNLIASHGERVRLAAAIDVLDTLTEQQTS